MDNTRQPEYGLSNNRFIDHLIREIIAVGDQLSTPIFRIENKFFIYDGDEQLHLPNKTLELFLIWTCKHLGMPEAIVYDVSFRDAAFGACWHCLKQ